MENTYRFIKRIENDLDFLTMLQKGIISLSVLDKKVYYEFYLSELEKTTTKKQAIYNTSFEFNVSESTIEKAVFYMRK